MNQIRPFPLSSMSGIVLTDCHTYAAARVEVRKPLQEAQHPPLHLDLCGKGSSHYTPLSACVVWARLHVCPGNSRLNQAPATSVFHLPALRIGSRMACETQLRELWLEGQS